MNERSRGSRHNQGSSNTWDTGSSSGNMWETGSSSGNTWDTGSSGGNMWETGTSQSGAGDSWGTSSNSEQSSSGNVWGSADESSSGTWGSEASESDNWGVYPGNDPWIPGGSKPPKPSWLDAIDGGTVKAILMIAGAVAVVAAVAYFLYSNADSIANGFQRLISAVTSAVVYGAIITIILYVVFNYVHFNLNKKMYLWVFVGITVAQLFKNVIPGLDSLVGAIIYSVLVVVGVIFLLKKLIKP